MKLSKIVFSGIAALCFFGLAVALPAQEGRGTGRVRGEVLDVEGNPIVGAQIVATHLESGTSFTGKSDKKGAWAVAGLGTGVFQFTVSAEGYETATHETQVSQFARNNPPLQITLKKIQAVDLNVPSIQGEESLALFNEGNRLFELGKYAEAAAKFEEFLEKNPALFQINLNLGNCYKQIGEYEKAVDSYTTILDKVKEEKGSYEGDESAARAFASIGETYVKKGDLEKANEALQQAIGLFPEDEALVFNVGEIFFSQKEIDKAIEYYQKAIGINEKWGPPHRQLGYAYLNKGDYRAAIESFKKFVEVDPDDPRAPEIGALIPKLEEMIKKSGNPFLSPGACAASFL